MSAPLRQLLPAPPAALRRRPFERHQESPKRQKTPKACAPCRAQKSKCSGEHPSCTACTKRGTVCTYPPTEARKARQKYNDLKQQRCAHEELLRLLRTLPESDATELLLQVRAGTDVAAIAKLVKGCEVLLQL